MFCSNCGKELEDSMQFCPACGMKTVVGKMQEDNTDIQSENLKEQFDSVKACTNGEERGQAIGIETEDQKRQDRPGIEVREEFEELSQMTQKVRNREKAWSMIGKVLAVCYLFLVGRNLFREVSAVLDETASIWSLVYMCAGVVLIACIAVYVFLEIALPRVNAKKNILAGEYLKLITVNDNQALMKAVNGMHCFSVKNAYMDENGNVCIQGKRCKHRFCKNEEGELTLISDKDNYKTALEKESIAGCLLKHLSLDAPVNAYENERYNERLSKAKRILFVVSAVSAVIFIYLMINSNMMEGSTKYIRMVKSGTPQAYPEISYGDAFDAFFKNGRWKYFKSEKEQDVVEFHGNCIFDGETTDFGIQFLVSYEEGTFEMYAVSLDDEPQTEFVGGLLLMKVFESYDSNDGIGTLSNDEEEADVDAADLESEEPEEKTETDQTENQAVQMGTDLLYPILYRGYAGGYNPCPVMVNDDISGEVKCGTFDEMLASIVDDGQTMYAPPIMESGKIYTATRWDAPEAEWYNGLLTYEQFSTLIFWMQVVHDGNGAVDIYTGGSWSDVGAMAGRWSGGNQEMAISIFSDIDYCSAYDAVGNISIGNQKGTLYLFGREGSNVYVQCLMENGEEMVFCYQDNGSMQVWYASEGCPVEAGTQLTCVERFVS